MKKVTIPVLLLLVLTAFVSCKKKSQIYTTMTVQVSGDSAWTTTDVTTENDNNEIVYISGYDDSSDKTISLTLNGYEPGNRTYIINTPGSVPASNQSQALYTSGGIGSSANSGQIVITNTTTKVLMGTFNFDGGKIQVSGTFSAPLP
jgi:hypothetical protein